MKPLDYMTLFALFAGPAMAVGIQLWFSNRQEERRRMLGVLDILMQYRGRIIHSDSVRALNSIDVVYYDSPVVRSRFTTLLDFLDSEEVRAVPRAPHTTARLDDLLTELLSEMCKVLGYKFDHTRIKTKVYKPKAFADEEEFIQDLREALMPLLRGTTPLHIRADQEPTHDHVQDRPQQPPRTLMHDGQRR